MVLIDTSVFIALERGLLDAAAIEKKAGAGENVAISAITLSELLHGVHRANTEARRAKRELFVSRATANLPIVSIDAEVARVHARLVAEFDRTGQPMGAHDLWIGCSALVHGASIMTRDLRSFPRIPDLSVIAC